MVIVPLNRVIIYVRIKVEGRSLTIEKSNSSKRSSTTCNRT